MPKKTQKTTHKTSSRAAAMSSKIEGLSLLKAKKDKTTIKILKQYGILSV